MNETFRKTAAAVSHPVFWLAILLLFFNDHFLRVLHPSWLSGILGDFAWLFIAPLALLLALSIGWERVPRGLALFAFGLVGAVYTLGNTWPAFLAWLGGLAGQVLRSPVNMVSDVGDLLALPALLAGYLFWKKVRGSAWFSNPQKIFVVFGALMTAGLTIANMPVTNVGLHKLRTTKGTIFACTTQETYISEDGGFTWLSDVYKGCCWCAGEWSGILSIDQDGREVQYRFSETTNAIESSTNGETWKLEYQLTPGSQADQALYERIFPMSGPNYQFVWDMDYDPVSGNVIAAMNMEGVLVRTTDGTWHQVGVGEYYPRRVRNLQDVLFILSDEIILAILMGLLLVCILAVKIKVRISHVILLLAAFFFWILACMDRPAVFSWDNFAEILMIGCGIFILPALIISIIWLFPQPDRMLIAVFSTAFGTALVFLIAFVLWGFNIIKEYDIAMLIGFGVALVGLILEIFLVRPLPDLNGRSDTGNL